MSKDKGASLRDRATHEPNPQAVSAAPVGVPSAEDAFRIGVDLAGAYLANYARKLAYSLEAGPIGSNGWPSTPEGAARHELIAFAGSIEECVRHEALSPFLCSLASAMSGSDTAHPDPHLPSESNHA